ncbi:MAG: hypothetical protein V1708_00965 [Candidatus Micrarchaeota archaeon]
MAAIAMFLLLGSMVVQPDQTVRLLTVIPILGAYFAFMILYALEVDAFSKAAPSPQQGDLRSEIQRATSDLAILNGMATHERHTHLRAIEFPMQSPRLAETVRHEEFYGRSY